MKYLQIINEKVSKVFEENLKFLMELSKIDDDNFVFRLETYNGGPVQTIYFERIK